MLFRFESRVPAPAKVIFSFHENPACLALLHGGWSHLKVLEHPTHIRVGAETWVEQMVYKCIPVVLGFRHHVYDPPHCFGEVLIHGPFSRFDHIHEFAETAGETIIIDRLDIEWPWQFGGDLVMQGLIAPQVKTMFRKRSDAIVRLWGDGTIQKEVSKKEAAKTY